MRLLTSVIMGIMTFCVLSSVAVAEGTSYLIGPGDVLEISVWKDESLSRNVIVPPDGVISFPLIGDIDVNNMTITTLRNTVRKKLGEFVKDVTVTVLLTQINSLRAYVIGKVNRPGQFPINQDTTVMQILTMAGGLNPYADEGKINILRQNGNETTRIPFDYKDIVKGKNLEQNILIKKGDVVVVP